MLAAVALVTWSVHSHFPFSLPANTASLSPLRSALSHDARPVMEKAQSWTTKRGLKTHVEMYIAGLSQGKVPEQWLADSSLHICQVCSRLISFRTRPCCPRCFRAFNGRCPSSRNDPSHPDAPDLNEVPSSKVPLRMHFPKAAGEVWARCPVAALSGVALHTDTRARTELLLGRQSGGTTSVRTMAGRRQRIPLAKTFFAPRKRKREPQTDDNVTDIHDDTSDA